MIKFHVTFLILSERAALILRFSSKSVKLRNFVLEDWKASLQIPGYTSHEWLLSTWCDIPCEPGLYRLTGYYESKVEQYGGCYVIDRQGRSIS